MVHISTSFRTQSHILDKVNIKYIKLGKVNPVFKYHIMKIYLLNSAPCYKDILGSGGIDPHILDLGTRWR